jgi:membrane protease YdiL (CAAX protease family)
VPLKRLKEDRNPLQCIQWHDRIPKGLRSSGRHNISYKLQAESSTIAQGARRRSRDLIEFAVAYGLISLAIWTPRPWQQWLGVTVLTWVLAAIWLSFDGWRAMGLRVVRIWSAAWVVGVALVLAAVAIGLAVRLHTLHLPRFPAQFLQRYWSYTIWAFLQEFLLLSFFFPRLLRLLPNKYAAAVAATVMFALMHLPNPVLTPLTLIWGYAACLIFLRYRNIYAPALAHAIFGICIAITIPGWVDHNMRVGLGYLTYREPRRHPRSQIEGKAQPIRLLEPFRAETDLRSRIGIDEF